MATYRAVMLTGKGDPDVLREVELPVIEPGTRRSAPRRPRHRRRRHRRDYAAGLLPLRARRSPSSPATRWSATSRRSGRASAACKIGQRVAGLMIHGGYAEKLTAPGRGVRAGAGGVDDATAVALILNYATAWQAIHRIAKVKARRHRPRHRRNGGVGTAMLELLQSTGARAFGAAAVRHHELRARRSARRRSRAGRSRSIAGMRRLLPPGVDVTIDNLGGGLAGQSIRATRRGGLVVGIGFSATGGSVSGFLQSARHASTPLAPLTGRKCDLLRHHPALSQGPETVPRGPREALRARGGGQDQAADRRTPAPPRRSPGGRDDRTRRLRGQDRAPRRALAAAGPDEEVESEEDPHRQEDQAAGEEGIEPPAHVVRGHVDQGVEETRSNEGPGEDEERGGAARREQRQDHHEIEQDRQLELALIGVGDLRDVAKASSAGGARRRAAAPCRSAPHRRGGRPPTRGAPRSAPPRRRGARDTRLLRSSAHVPVRPRRDSWGFPA